MFKGLRRLVINLLAFVFVGYFYPGFTYGSNFGTLVLAGVVFSLLTIFVKPVITLLSLPFNLLTFGLFSIFSNIIILYIVTYLIHGFKIVSYNFNGLTLSGFVLPHLFVSPFFAALIASLFLGLITTILVWILK